VEIEFTGKIQGTETIFDSNIKKDIEKSGLKLDAKPLIFSLGQGMFLKSVDDFLIGKEPGKKYSLDLEAKNAFGIRDTKLIQLIPMNIFKKHNLNPVVGGMFNFDGRVGKVLSVSGGRIRVDFNHPLASKDVSYEINVLRKVDDLNEKIDAFNTFLFRKKFKKELKDKEKQLVLEVEKPLVQFVQMFKDKFKEILGLELVIKEVEVPAQKK
jgi:FKBP-type peptidyl-prolyl cis-trans isomerase 2